MIARVFVGRRLIGVLAAALIGLVFVQVALLKLNTQISANAERSQLLTRQNAEQRALLARLDAAQRVTGAANNLGLMMPAPDAVCYLKATDKRACSVSGSAADSLQNANVDPSASGGQTVSQTDQTASTTDQTSNSVDQTSMQSDQGTSGTGGSPSQGGGTDQTQSQSPTADAGSGGLVAGAGG